MQVSHRPPDPSKHRISLTGACHADMASIQSFIDVHHPASQGDWWEKALGEKAESGQVQDVTLWRQKYMLRRGKDVLVGTFGELQPKEIKAGQLVVNRAEIAFYEIYENSFLHILDMVNQPLMLCHSMLITLLLSSHSP